METTATPNKGRLAHYIPILNWLPQYQKDRLRVDDIAGLTVLALLIPEGLAYAEIAGLPPQTAFYAAPVGVMNLALPLHFIPTASAICSNFCCRYSKQ